MKTRRIGTVGPEVSELGLGCMGMSFAYGARDDLPADDFRRSQPRWSSENFTANLKLVDVVRAIAEQIGCTPTQAALAWLLAQGDDILPIPETKRETFLTENVAAADFTLSPAQLAELDNALPAGAVSGERYNQQGMATLGH